MARPTLTGQPGPQADRLGPEPGPKAAPGAGTGWGTARVERAVLRGVLYAALALTAAVVLGGRPEARGGAELGFLVALAGLAASCRR